MPMRPSAVDVSVLAASQALAAAARTAFALPANVSTEASSAAAAIGASASAATSTAAASGAWGWKRRDGTGRIVPERPRRGKPLFSPLPLDFRRELGQGHGLRAPATRVL